MLERRRRIHTDRDHRNVWRAGRVMRGRTIVFRYAPSAADVSRYGFVVSSAVAKRATTRNLIKRRLRSIIRQVKTTRPLDVVIYATKTATTATFSDLKNDLLQIIEHINAPTPHRHH